MTGFNKTLDVNLEYTGLDYTRNQSINHQQFFRKKENTKQVSSPLIWIAAAMLSVPSSMRFLMPSRFLVPLLLMMLRQKSRLRCNVEASRRWSLVDFLFSLARRRDVPASFLLFFYLLQNDPKNHPFHLLFTYNAKIRYRAINCVFNYKIELKPKDRRGYDMSVLGAHHTPKLSFVLVPKQETEFKPDTQPTYYNLTPRL